MSITPLPSGSRDGPDSTFLEPQETNPAVDSAGLHSADPRAYEDSISFRHRMYHWHRRRVMDAFGDLRVHPNREYAFLACGNSGWVVQSQSDQTRYALRANCCHDRWCPACARSRARVLRANLEPLLAGRTVRFITLTLKHDDMPLGRRLDRLFGCFANLRAHAAWHQTVSAGVMFAEVKHNAETGRWHPHLHIVCIGSYLPQSTLRAAWLEVTGDSHVVDIRIVHDETIIAKYVTKYITKPCPNELYRDRDKLADAIVALKGRRLVTTFGDWRGSCLLRNETLEDWAPIMPWPELLRRCRELDPIAIDIYKAVTRNEWCADDTSMPSLQRAPPSNLTLFD